MLCYKALDNLPSTCYTSRQKEVRQKAWLYTTCKRRLAGPKVGANVDWRCGIEETVKTGVQRGNRPSLKPPA